MNWVKTEDPAQNAATRTMKTIPRAHAASAEAGMIGVEIYLYDPTETMPKMLFY
jgi:hypothetical protein